MGYTTCMVCLWSCTNIVATTWDCCYTTLVLYNTCTCLCHYTQVVCSDKAALSSIGQLCFLNCVPLYSLCVSLHVFTISLIFPSFSFADQLNKMMMRLFYRLVTQCSGGYSIHRLGMQWWKVVSHHSILPRSIIYYYYYYYYYLEVPDYFIELLNDKNEDIHKIASEIVNVLTVSKSIIQVLYCTLTYTK